MHVGARRQMRKMGITRLSPYLCVTLILILIALPAQAYTTEVHVVKFAADSVSIINETTVNYSWMQSNLPVYGDGVAHYYHQGPTFDPANLWDPGETINIDSRDFGAAQGSDIKDLCDLVGGMAAGDWVKIKASDGFFKSFDYDDVYLPEPELGRMVIAWYNPTYGGYPPAYDKGMRLIFFANTTNPDGKYVFGNWDMHETLNESRWHYYYGSGTLWPSSSGLSVHSVNRLEIYSRLAAPKLSIIEISPATAEMFAGDKKQFGATARDQYNNELPGIVFAWASSNESVGTVDLDGLFQALAPGNTEITATNGSITGSTIATVLPIPIALWGPYVTNTTTTSATIHWKTENATTGTVKYANESYYAQHGDYARSVEDGAEKQLHHLTLTNLSPDTVYHYRMEIENRSTGDCSFRTFPLNGSFTFIVYSDSQEPQGEPGATQLTRHKLVADRIAEEENVTFVLHCGDLVNDGGDLEEWNRFFEAARALMATTTFYTTLGNHEYRNFSGSGEAVQIYYAAFRLPEWYSFDCGDAHFTVLDSNDEANENTETAWLLNDLAPNATWKFVSFHHPPYSSSSKHFGGWTDRRDRWCPIFVNSSVNTVFNGHMHAYERLQADGIKYVVLGTGGGPLYELNETKLPESRHSLEDTLGYARVTVDADVGTVTMTFVKVADCSSGMPELYDPVEVFETVLLGSTHGIFDTGASTYQYPSISGIHQGALIICPDQDITVSSLYTYPCPGTGGHTEYIKIGNSSWNVTANWLGYHTDWHTIPFEEPFTLKAGETYNYTIITSSYPQTLHKQNHTTLDDSLITCTEFVDANGKSYTDWIPAFRLEGEKR